jgi:organic radical activating enzyme
MKFPWEKYEEIGCERKNTLQVFITNRCNLRCDGCFARNVIKENNSDIGVDEYKGVVSEFLEKDGKQINLIGGEPLLHPYLRDILDINRGNDIKTTIYTNGYFLNDYIREDFENIKIRVSIYCKSGSIKSSKGLPQTDIPIDVCYMVSKDSTLDDMLESAREVEENYNCNVFFISSIRELDNGRKEFFDDASLSMNMLKYKEIVHNFLDVYEGNMEVHISKRGVFESTKNVAGNKCKFSNYFIGGKIIQCPYDIVNLKFQKDYKFDSRYCQHNNTCLMSKIKLKKK